MSDDRIDMLHRSLAILRNDHNGLLQRFNALEERVRQQLAGSVEAGARPPVDAAPASGTDYERAAALARGIITRPPGAGGQHD